MVKNTNTLAQLDSTLLVIIIISKIPEFNSGSSRITWGSLSQIHTRIFSESVSFRQIAIPGGVIRLISVSTININLKRIPFQHIFTVTSAVYYRKENVSTWVNFSCPQTYMTMMTSMNAMRVRPVAPQVSTRVNQYSPAPVVNRVPTMKQKRQQPPENEKCII